MKRFLHCHPSLRANDPQRQRLPGLRLLAMTMILCILMTIKSSSPHALDHPLTEVQAKLVIIHSFISEYVRWPGRYSLDETHQIAICSLGEDELTKDLQQLEKASTDALSVRVVKNPDDMELKNCHVIYFADTQKADFREQLQKIKGFPVLTVGGFRQFIDGGGMVALVTKTQRQGNFEKNYVRYSLNSQALTKARLFIEPDAIELAERVVKQ